MRLRCSVGLETTSGTLESCTLNDVGYDIYLSLLIVLSDLRHASRDVGQTKQHVGQSSICCCLVYSLLCSLDVRRCELQIRTRGQQQVHDIAFVVFQGE